MTTAEELAERRRELTEDVREQLKAISDEVPDARQRLHALQHQEQVVVAPRNAVLVLWHALRSMQQQWPAELMQGEGVRPAEQAPDCPTPEAVGLDVWEACQAQAQQADSARLQAREWANEILTISDDLENAVDLCAAHVVASTESWLRIDAFMARPVQQWLEAISAGDNDRQRTLRTLLEWLDVAAQRWLPDEPRSGPVYQAIAALRKEQREQEERRQHERNERRRRRRARATELGEANEEEVEEAAGSDDVDDDESLSDIKLIDIDSSIELEGPMEDSDSELE